MQWGRGKARLGNNLNLESQGFSEKALELFLEKLDSHRLLFTSSEVKSFRSEARHAWYHWLRSKRCEYFDQWVTSHYSSARARFRKNLETSPLPKLSGKTDSEEDPQKRYPRFTGFAGDEKELKTRLQSWLSQMASTTQPMVLEAYGGNLRYLLSDSLEQVLFESEPDARGILAKAVLGSIDPYSTYFSPLEFEDFYHDLSAGTSGIGVKVRKVPDGLLVEKVITNSPAGRSGKMKEGQIITKVNKQKLAGVQSLMAKNLLKGDEGSPVALELQKSYKGKSFVVTITRKNYSFDEGRVSLRTIKAGKDKKSVAVIQIPSFYGRGGMTNFEQESSSSEDLHNIVEKLINQKERPQALVLDLRGNPGGFLEEAVAMAGTFVGDRPVVEVVETENRRILRDDQMKPLFTGALVLLTDQETASASEVLAGALKDHQRAVLVGSQHTYGKGSVQKLFHLDDQMGLSGFAPVLGRGVVKLTTSVFYSPLGHTPANGGVRPHIILPELEDKDSEDAPTLSFAIPEEKPFLDEVAMQDLKKNEVSFHPRVEALEMLSQKRRQALEKSDESVEESWATTEAAWIANDLASLEQDEIASNTKSQVSP